MRVAWVPVVLAMSLVLAAAPQAGASEDDCPGTYYTITPELSGRVEVCPGEPPAPPEAPSPLDWLPPLPDEPGGPLNDTDLGAVVNHTDPADPPVQSEACDGAWGSYLWLGDWGTYACVRVDLFLPDGPLVGPMETETMDCEGGEEGLILLTPAGAYGVCMTRDVTDQGQFLGVSPDECELESAPARDPAVYVLGYGVAVCVGVVAEPGSPDEEPPGTGIDLTPCEPEAVDPVVRVGDVVVQVCLKAGFEDAS